jgi:organic hydroperoxide reductase OsmC/OhrA
MTAKFPHEYVVSVDRIGAGIALVGAPPRPDLTGGPPPEFRGDAHNWSPEHLLAAALGLCVYTTFDAFAQQDKLDIAGYRDVVTAVLDRTSSGLALKRLTVSVEITVESADVERARATFERAKKACIVSRALSVPVIVEPHIWCHDHRDHSAVAS